MRWGGCWRACSPVWILHRRVLGWHGRCWHWVVAGGWTRSWPRRRSSILPALDDAGAGQCPAWGRRGRRGRADRQRAGGRTPLRCHGWLRVASAAAGQGWAEAAEAEHGQGDEGLGALEPERDPGEQ